MWSLRNRFFCCKKQKTVPVPSPSDYHYRVSLNLWRFLFLTEIARSCSQLVWEVCLDCCARLPKGFEPTSAVMLFMQWVWALGYLSTSGEPAGNHVSSESNESQVLCISNGKNWPVEPGGNFSEDVIVVRVNSVAGFCVSLQSNHKHIPLYILWHLFRILFHVEPL
jgi:hypothetical protein